MKIRNIALPLMLLVVSSQPASALPNFSQRSTTGGSTSITNIDVESETQRTSHTITEEFKGFSSEAAEMSTRYTREGNIGEPGNLEITTFQGSPQVDPLNTYVHSIQQVEESTRTTESGNIVTDSFTEFEQFDLNFQGLN